MQRFSDLIAIENLDTRYPGAHDIEDDHSLGWAEFYIAMIGAIGSLRARFSVKRRTKVIATTAAINDSQRMHLC